MVAIPEDLEADQTDRRRDAAAILDQRGERVVAGVPQIHLDAIDQLVESTRGRLNSRTYGFSPMPCGVRRRSLVRRRQLRTPARPARGRLRSRLVAQATGPFALRHHFIDGIVDRPAEIPDRDDGVALARRQHQKRVVEVRVAAHVVAARL